MFQAPLISPKTIPGPPLEAQSTASSRFNSARADWGPNVVAYGCQNFVMILDPVAVQHVNSLDGHQSIVTICRWAPAPATSRRWTSPNPPLLLATGDESGVIYIWDVNSSRIEYTLIDSSNRKPIVDIRWVRRNGFLHLASLSDNSVLTMWNIPSQTKVWSKSFSDPIACIALNPFNDSVLCLPATDGHLTFVNDFNPSAAPEKIERKLRVGSTSGATSSGGDTSVLRQVVYSSHARGQVLLVLRRDVTIFDLTLGLTVTSLQIPGGRADFRHVHMPQDDPNSLLSFHDDGSVAVWFKNPATNAFEPTWTDVIRGGKIGGSSASTRSAGGVYAVCFSDRTMPANAALCAIGNDGKAWLWNVAKSQVAGERPRWSISGLLEGVSAPPSCMHVCPFDSRIAVGTISGTLLIFDLTTGALESKYELFGGVAVRAVRWVSPTRLVGISTKQRTSSASGAPGGGFENRLVSLDLFTGRVTDMRKSSELERASMLALRVSPSYHHMVLLFAEGPTEVWDLTSNTLLRIINLSQVNTVEWRPARTNDKGATAPEQFYFVGSDGSLHFYTVDRQRVAPDTRKSRAFSYSTISALAWKDELLVGGDIAGTLSCLDISKWRQQQHGTHRGLVRRLRFSPDPQSHLIIALHADGDFSIWDMDQGVRVSHSLSKERDVRALDVDWAYGNRPVIVTRTGSIMVLDLTLGPSNAPIAARSLAEPTRALPLLPSPALLTLKTSMEHALVGQDEDGGATSPADLQMGGRVHRNGFGEVISNDIAPAGIPHVALLDDETRERLSDPKTSFAERCLIAARLLADDEAIQFWSLVSHFLPIYASGSGAKKKLPKPNFMDRWGNPAASSTQEDGSTVENVTTESEEGKASSEHAIDPHGHSPPVLPDVPLGPRHDLLLSSTALRAQESTLNNLHENLSRSASKPDFFRSIARNSALMGDLDSAIALLLETPDEHKDFLSNSLRACIVSAALSPASFQHTAKFVASKLVASGDVNGGVELLCLIGRGAEACRVLQTYDRWEEAARLAKTSLEEEECNVVLKRWAEQLITVGQKIKAAGVYVTMGHFGDALSALLDATCYETAALFSRACDEFSLLPAQGDVFVNICTAYEVFGSLLTQLGGVDKLAQQYREKAASLRAAAAPTQAEQIKPPQVRLFAQPQTQQPSRSGPEQATSGGHRGTLPSPRSSTGTMMAGQGSGGYVSPSMATAQPLSGPTGSQTNRTTTPSSATSARPARSYVAPSRSGANIIKSGVGGLLGTVANLVTGGSTSAPPAPAPKQTIGGGIPPRGGLVQPQPAPSRLQPTTAARPPPAPTKVPDDLFEGLVKPMRTSLSPITPGVDSFFGDSPSAPVPPQSQPPAPVQPRPSSLVPTSPDDFFGDLPPPDPLADLMTAPPMASPSAPVVTPVFDNPFSTPDPTPAAAPPPQRDATNPFDSDDFFS